MKDQIGEIVEYIEKQIKAADGYGWVSIHQVDLQNLRDKLESLGGWRPMADAPKDCRILLLFASGNVIGGNWNENKYATRQLPFWDHDLSYIYGRTRTRHEQPIGWQPLPAQPNGWL